MPVKVEKIGANQVELEITVPEETFAKQMKKIAKKVAFQVNVPGFRRGKAPLNVLEARLGKEYIWAETADSLIYPEYNSAVAESGIFPVSQPEADIVQLEAGKEFIYKVKVFVKPKIELGEYRNLGVARPEIKVTDEDVEAELIRRQRIHSKLVNIEEGTVEIGDMATVDFTGFCSGEPLENVATAGYDAIIGADAAARVGFEDQLPGVAIGEEKEIAVDFPADWRDDRLAGREVVFRVRVRGVKRVELLPLDDEFAKDVSEFDTLEEYREELRRLLLQNAAQRSMEQWRSEIMERAIGNAAAVDIPLSMIELKTDELMRDLEERAHGMGLSVEKYCAGAGLSFDGLREQYKEAACESVKMDLFLEEVAEQADIKVSDRELNDRLADLAEGYKYDMAALTGEMRRRGNLDRLMKAVTAEKTAKFVLRENGYPLPEEGAEPKGGGEILADPEDKAGAEAVAESVAESAEEV